MKTKRKPSRKRYVVYVKYCRSEPSFVPQYVFAYSAKDAVSNARAEGFVVSHARQQAD